VDVLTLLRVAEQKDEALGYFIKHYSYYKDEYEASAIAIEALAFVPVENQVGEHTRVRLSEVSI
jgi:hypothetical protein